MQNTFKHKMLFSTTFSLHVKAEERNFFVKTLRNIDPASSTFTLETQAVFHPAGTVTIVFIVPGKVTVKIGNGGDAGIKID